MHFDTLNIYTLGLYPIIILILPAIYICIQFPSIQTSTRVVDPDQNGCQNILDPESDLECNKMQNTL